MTRITNANNTRIVPCGERTPRATNNSRNPTENSPSRHEPGSFLGTAARAATGSRLSGRSKEKAVVRARGARSCRHAWSDSRVVRVCYSRHSRFKCVPTQPGGSILIGRFDTRAPTIPAQLPVAPQRNHWIDAACPPRRHERAKQCRRQRHHSPNYVRSWVQTRHAVERRLQVTRREHAGH
jgi:hypothetical protein